MDKLKELFTTYNEEIITATISFVVALLTTLLTHLLGNFKLRYTEKLKITSELSKKKYEGITKIREEIEILSHYEDLSITDCEYFPTLPEKVQTPACCYDYEILSNTASALNDLHSDYGHCLRHTSVIYLIYIRNFLLNYCTKCQRAEIPEELLRLASAPLYKGIHKWYKMFDKELIRSLNKPSMKYFAHSGLRYTILLKVYGWYFKRTAPYKYMNDENSPLNKLINNLDEILSEQEETIIDNSEE